MNIIELNQRFDRLERLLLSNKTVLTFEEGCEYTSIKPSYMYKLTSSKSIPHSKPNGKVIFFNKEKLESWMLQNEVKSKQDIESEALSYTLKNKKA
ncbi:helix-turn-helix domain-containing protein [Polaribacter sp. 20A6]|uniref:helix-turn-helix domain-containing protein n=1 Tax=Polaribacter sp. 20A6 TaxID=2687289 RepID=UPI0013FDE35A|nr:helix-turn-helix domain-containing protein [Polaribacter sp. 20A6]